MTEQERNQLANDLYWLHDLIGQASPCEQGLQVTQTMFDKANEKEIIEVIYSRNMLKHVMIELVVK